MKLIRYLSIILLIFHIALFELSIAGQESGSISSQLRDINSVKYVSDITHKEREIKKDLKMYEKPPLSPARIAGEIAIGEVLGGVYGVGLFFISAPISVGSSDCSGDEFLCGLDDALFIAYIGFMFGNAHGVYLVGNNGDQTGSFWASLGGCAAGALLGVTLARETEGVTAFTLPVVGATATFNLSRKYKVEGDRYSLVSLENNHLKLGYPKINFRQNSIDSSYYHNLNLFQYRF